MSNNNDSYKTAYRHAHYFQNVQDIEHKKLSFEKLGIRPDLFVYNPVINEKTTTYKKNYNEYKNYKKPFESYGRSYFTSKFSHKNLYEDFHARPIGVLTNNVTTSGSQYGNPMEKDEAELLSFFEKDQINQLEESCGPNYTEYVNPYISTSKYYFQDHTDSMLNGISKKDYITVYNKQTTNTTPPTKSTCVPKTNFFFKVPFYGDTSVYRESYTDPEAKNAYLAHVCPHPEYFETLKNDVSVIPKMYATEQMQIGKGNKVII